MRRIEEGDFNPSDGMPDTYWLKTTVDMLRNPESKEAFSLLDSVLATGSFQWQVDKIDEHEAAIEALGWFSGRLPVPALADIGDIYQTISQKMLVPGTEASSAWVYTVLHEKCQCVKDPGKAAMLVIAGFATAPMILEIFQTAGVATPPSELKKLATLKRVTSALAACSVLAVNCLEEWRQAFQETPPLPGT